MLETIIALTALNILQALFWTWQTHKLVDKLMSRNYAEYVQTEQLAKSPPSKAQTQLPITEDDEVLNELNGLLGGM